jgi:hypothetical protein
MVVLVVGIIYVGNRVVKLVAWAVSNCKFFWYPARRVQGDSGSSYRHPRVLVPLAGSPALEHHLVWAFIAAQTEAGTEVSL